jgi:hypothetical protein
LSRRLRRFSATGFRYNDLRHSAANGTHGSVDVQARERPVLYGRGVTIERPLVAGPRALPALWLTVAFNLFALFVAVLVIALDSEVTWPIWLPVASLALSGCVAASCLVRQQTRRVGVGLLGGTGVAISAFLVLFVVFVVAYFIVPGGHELS